MDREGGNKEKLAKCREWISLHFLILFPFPPQFLILSPFPLHFLGAQLPGCNKLWNPRFKNENRGWMCKFCTIVVAQKTWQRICIFCNFSGWAGVYIFQNYLTVPFHLGDGDVGVVSSCEGGYDGVDDQDGEVEMVTQYNYTPSLVENIQVRSFFNQYASTVPFGLEIVIVKMLMTAMTMMMMVVMMIIIMIKIVMAIESGGWMTLTGMCQKMRSAGWI